MTADAAVAHIATVGAVAAFLVSIGVWLARQRRTKHRHADKIVDDARAHQLPQQALVDDPDISVPPLSGFAPELGSGVHPSDRGGSPVVIDECRPTRHQAVPAGSWSAASADTDG